jgi:hypothetical protein
LAYLDRVLFLDLDFDRDLEGEGEPAVERVK